MLVEEGKQYIAMLRLQINTFNFKDVTHWQKIFNTVYYEIVNAFYASCHNNVIVTVKYNFKVSKKLFCCAVFV